MACIFQAQAEFAVLPAQAPSHSSVKFVVLSSLAHSILVGSESTMTQASLSITPISCYCVSSQLTRYKALKGEECLERGTGTCRRVHGHMHKW